MANREQSVAPTASGGYQHPFESPSVPLDFNVNSRSLTLTTTVEVLISGTSGLHTALKETVSTTPSPVQHDFATADTVAHTAANPTHLEHVRPLSSPGMTTILNLDSATKSSLSNSTPTQTVSTRTPGTVLGKAQHTLTTVTRSHNTTHSLSTKIAYVNSKWPQVGTIVSESDIPERWRETFEMQEMRIQYTTLGAICGVFVLGVLGVLALGWWKCWWNGECVCSRMKKKKYRERFDWYG